MGRQMGNVPPGTARAAPMTQEEADALSMRCHYEPRELLQLHRQYIAEAPTGYIPRVDFGQLAAVMNITEPHIGDLIFNLFDADKDGYISFGEFAMAMSTMTRGTPDEKLRLAFRLYDTGGEGGRAKGYLEKQDLLRTVGSLQRMLGGLVQVGEQGQMTVEQLVDKLFDEMDTDRDGRISYEEYMEGARRDPAIVQGLALS